MKLESTNIESDIDTNTKSFSIPGESLEIVVIEDNKLINMLFSKVLDSTISRIRNLKQTPIKFSSFQSGAKFLRYLNTSDFGKSKLIVFSDYYLEKEVNGAEILKNINQKGIDATVIIMSDTTNKQTSVDTIDMGAHRFIPKDKETPVVCSEILNQMVI